MSDGSGKVAREQGRVSVERLLVQRDTARSERDRLHVVIDELVRLKDDPRDDAYRAEKDAAWQAAREALRR